MVGVGSTHNIDIQVLGRRENIKFRSYLIQKFVPTIFRYQTRSAWRFLSLYISNEIKYYTTQSDGILGDLSEIIRHDNSLITFDYCEHVFRMDNLKNFELFRHSAIEQGAWLGYFYIFDEDLSFVIMHTTHENSLDGVFHIFGEAIDWFQEYESKS